MQKGDPADEKKPLPSEEISKVVLDFQEREKQLENEIKAKDDAIKRL